ncbi:MAG: ABC transporter permease [Candidatus Woesearchaeota archaeon]|jgi:putative ABC transport system permease protein|nr:ABC transporter permease [Candidatus Woesearchaeota archaeon]MDP7622838.1 ABC transporter permease [Candidatus Woesearchaeota archaeon]HJN56902.1 ABC transporter permease [Candidatus Woesearchaeota archaeon]|tara:strand:+ start:43951 stop:45162 length:1212 start_codon:yes stop_codon:yes gene_type:complete
MKTDEIKYSLQNLVHRKTRSLLTMLSILIGVMAIFALISFGLGIRNYMDTIAEEAGADKLFIQARSVGVPGTDANFFVSADDINFVSKINGVDEISGMYIRAGEVKFKKEKKFVFIAGTDIDKKEFVEKAFTVGVEKGRQLKKNELGKVVLGYNYQFEDKIFSKAIKLGNKIEINGNSYEVVGFYGLIGNPQDDSNAYLNYRSMELLFEDIKDEFGWAMIGADKNTDPEVLAEKIEEKLRKFKDQEEGKEDFFVQTFADVLATFGTIINVLNGILILIALISIIVASVNIMNTMYTAVLERTKEIGIMKAIGAKNSDILFIFIFESGLLGMVGGIIGVILGYLISSAGGQIAAASGFAMLQPVFPLYLIIGSILFAFLVGAASGIMPSIKASKLNPVDALRYE